MNQNPRQTHEYSTAFDKLVHGSDVDADIVGLLAYALYKPDKRELAAGGILDEDHLREHHKTLTSGLLTQYRESALRLLESYSQEVVDRAEPEIRADARIEAVETARDVIVREIQSSTAWGWSILWNVVAWLISLAIVFLVTVGAGKVSLQISGP